MTDLNTELAQTLLAEILCMMARHGYEVELKPARLHIDLIVGHSQPLPTELIVTLGEKGFGLCSRKKGTYTDIDGAIRYRSHFRKDL
ncbi:MAG TPA: hypothetical protein VE130_15450 [Nitrososphaeraceae archaeon]|nr:hypothetical protein [Nitrososphaeraceae archaeon]